ncbi:MAG: UvrD-helicase domain-containing protein, partial [Candidatus Micrarchaeia archaeon]
MELNENQKLALATDRHIAVTAGAGTGKTRVLVQRYADIVRSGGADIDNALALTFTEKAAAEMKNRVREELHKGLLAANGEKELRRAEQLFESFRDPHISTFHSFCAAALREFPIEAGVDPAFTILDEPRAAAGVEQALHDFLDEKNTAGDPDLRALAALWDRAAIAEKLRALNASRFPGRRWAERVARLSADQIENNYHELADKWMLAGGGRGAVQNLFDRLRACACHDDGDILAPAYYDALRFLQQLLDGADADFDSMAKITARGGKKDSWDDVKVIRSLLPEARALAAKLAAFRFGAKDAAAAQFARALARLHLAFLDRCEQSRGRGAALDFDDLEIKMLQLLEGAPAARLALRKRFRYVLIDEFQDTNDIQWEIIRKIAVDEKGRIACNMFIVGDEKQSIYAFRGANVAVFDRARAAMDACNQAEGLGAGRVPLDVCYRSHPALIRFFNTVFAGIFSAAPAEDFLTKIDYFNIEAGRGDNETDNGPRVEFLLPRESAGRDPELPSAWESEAAMAA